MSLRDVLAYVQTQQRPVAGVTPVTPENSTGLQRKPAWIGAVPPVTPVTPVFDNAQVNAAIAGPGTAANDPHAIDTSPPAPVPETVDWRALDAAYQAHHAHCHVCQAAGRGARYSLRCGVGASLWRDYTTAVMQPGALPWQQARGRG